MNDFDNIQEITDYLFGRPYDEDLSDEEQEQLDELSEKQIETFGWKATFEDWMRFLTQRCASPESAINFAHLFWGYDGCAHPIDDPHKFLGYFYYRIAFDVMQYDNGMMLDGLAITILPKAGFSEADLVLNPEYVPECDPKIIAAAEQWRREEEDKAGA